MKNKKLTMIQLDVSADDIREMYERYNSGMCDISTANAVSIALRFRIKRKYTPSIVFARNHDACILRIGENEISLPQNLYWWLRESENGIEVKPSSFSFAIFSEFLIRKKIKVAYIPNLPGLPITTAEDAVPIFNDDRSQAS